MYLNRSVPHNMEPATWMPTDALLSGTNRGETLHIYYRPLRIRQSLTPPCRSPLPKQFRICRSNRIWALQDCTTAICNLTTKRSSAPTPPSLCSSVLRPSDDGTCAKGFVDYRGQIAKSTDANEVKARNGHSPGGSSVDKETKLSSKRSI
jgi:hypothetical protein